MTKSLGGFTPPDNRNSQKNIPWINYVKGICILFVYLLHCGTFYGYSVPIIGKYYAPFFVNAFFFVSGYLIFRKQLSEKIISKNTAEYIKTDGKDFLLNVLNRMIIPSIIFAATEFFPSYIIQGRTISVSEFLFKTFGGGTYWFTSALIVAEIIVFILLLSRRKSAYFYLFCALLISAVGIFLCTEKYEFLRNLWEWKQGLLSVIFLGCGGVYYKLEEKIKKVDKLPIVLLLFVVYVILIKFFKSYFKVTISVQELNFLGILISLLSIFVFISLVKRINTTNKITEVLSFIGKNSMCYYFMSGALPIVISKVMNMLIPTPNAIGLTLVYVLCITIAYIATYIMNRIIPFVFDLRYLKKYFQKA